MTFVVKPGIEHAIGPRLALKANEAMQKLTNMELPHELAMIKLDLQRALFELVPDARERAPERQEP